MGKRLTVEAHLIPDGTAITVQGRNAWALLERSRPGRRAAPPSTTPARDGLAICSISSAPMAWTLRHGMRHIAVLFPVLMPATYF